MQPPAAVSPVAVPVAMVQTVIVQTVVAQTEEAHVLVALVDPFALVVSSPLMTLPSSSSCRD